MKLPSGRFLVITVLHSFTNKQKSWCVRVHVLCANEYIFPFQFCLSLCFKETFFFSLFQSRYVSFFNVGLNYVCILSISWSRSLILYRNMFKLNTLSLSPSPATLLPFSRFCVKVALRSFVTFCPAYPNYQVFRVGLSTHDPEAV